MKNTSLENKDTALISVLQSHFKGELNLARVKLISLFITALCKIKTINYDRLASGFDTKVDKKSSYRRSIIACQFQSIPLIMNSNLQM